MIESLETGISLIGAEVKSIKQGHMNLNDAFVKIMGSEAYLVNADIPVYQYARPQGYDSRRSRKLLLHKKELLRFKTKIQSGERLTLAPVNCYNKAGLIKLEIALVKGRRQIEKKKLDKERDIRRAQEREMKEYVKS